MLYELISHRYKSFLIYLVGTQTDHFADVSKMIWEEAITVVIYHSFFSASAGFVFAARKVCQRTDRKAMTMEMITAMAMIQP